MANPYDVAHGQSIMDPNGSGEGSPRIATGYKKWDKVLDDSRKPFLPLVRGGGSTPATTRSTCT